MGDHDENITYERTVEMVGEELAAKIRDTAIRIYKEAADIALTKGLIIADTKFEFGLTEDGDVGADGRSADPRQLALLARGRL